MHSRPWYSARLRNEFLLIDFTIYLSIIWCAFTICRSCILLYLWRFRSATISCASFTRVLRSLYSASHAIGANEIILSNGPVYWIVWASFILMIMLGWWMVYLMMWRLATANSCWAIVQHLGWMWLSCVHVILLENGSLNRTLNWETLCSSLIEIDLLDLIRICGLGQRGTIVISNSLCLI